MVDSLYSLGTYKQGVIGSSPISPTIKIPNFISFLGLGYGPIAQLVRAEDS